MAIHYAARSTTKCGFFWPTGNHVKNRQDWDKVIKADRCQRCDKELSKEKK